jgi:hypothetical protein
MDADDFAQKECALGLAREYNDASDYDMLILGGKVPLVSKHCIHKKIIFENYFFAKILKRGHVFIV